MAVPYVEVVRIRDASTTYTTDVEARTDLNTQPNAVSVSYTSAPTQSAHIDDPFNSRNVNFASTDIIYNNEDGVIFINRDENFVSHSFGFSKISNFNNKYTGTTTYNFSYSDQGGVSGSSRQIFTEKFLLSGYKTLLADIPTAGQKIYNCYLATTTVSYDGGGGLQGMGNLTVDFGQRTITGSVASSQTGWVSGTSPVSATLNLSGTFTSSNNSLAGQVTSSDSFSGQFYGGLFGPQGTEMQIIFTISRLGKGAAGHMICK